jgi:hypothetical protein
MLIIAALCQLLFIVTVTVVGVRMLLLAHRTRGRHELLMGAGMVLVAAVGTPAGIVSGFGKTVAEMSLPLWLTSTLATQIGITLIYAFTWQVFRPADALGKAIVAGAVLCMGMGIWIGGRALATAAPDASSPLVARNGIFVAMIGYSGCFLWSAIEGFVQYDRARKRLSLGLADAVVANRFLLWGLFGSSATVINVASVAANAMGLDPTRSVIVLIPLGVCGLAASVTMYLAFLPPAAYLAFVRAQRA